MSVSHVIFSVISRPTFQKKSVSKCNLVLKVKSSRTCIKSDSDLYIRITLSVTKAVPTKGDYSHVHTGVKGLHARTRMNVAFNKDPIKASDFGEIQTWQRKCFRWQTYDSWSFFLEATFLMPRKQNVHACLNEHEKTKFRKQARIHARYKSPSGTLGTLQTKTN